MLLVSYDISDNRLRTRFSKELEKYGFRLQYSLFEIRNSEHIIDNIVNIITDKFEKQFSQSDSIMIIRLNPNCDIIKFGYAANEDKEVFVVG